MFGGIFLLGIAYPFFLSFIYSASSLKEKSYGGTFSVVPTLTSELFGLQYFGGNYGFVVRGSKEKGRGWNVDKIFITQNNRRGVMRYYNNKELIGTCACAWF
jgi:hypothetical protein